MSALATRSIARITLIEQGSDISFLLSDFFRKEGYEWNLFESGAAALQWLAQGGKADVILSTAVSDLNELTETLKSKYPNSPLVVMVDASNINVAMNAIQAGAFFYLVKPIQTPILKIVIDRALGSALLSNDPFEDFPTIDELEKRYMKVVLEKTKGKKEKASRILGINRRTLYRKEREYGWVSDDEATSSDAGLDQGA